jgi:hypothetical protein
MMRYLRAKVCSSSLFCALCVYWTAIGDYQFDIYRIMREHNGGEWEGYRPLTNVMVSLSNITLMGSSTSCDSGCITCHSNYSIQNA